ncbi:MULTISPECIES: LysR family transcriptional regulator [Brevundimonas]|uniref:LysR family transcriptional regulator n=1 Tax=Brevundimonas TaxID=41275 RepID=UPI000E673494|nr:LysR family transcriptional regulator [Brevundimonas sp. LPMIX5]RIJ65709.1 LysR family transcriptional regulator [Brevundimonas sp. LPMIX5]
MSRWDGIDEFTAVAEQASFSAAARRLGLSTSAVSREIARLEDRLQTRLLHRTTRRVELTDAGRDFLARCRRLIDERDEALAAVQPDDQAPRGLLRMTCSVSYGERFIAPAVNAFAKLNPELRIELDLDNRLRDLVGDGYDLAVRFGHLTDSRLMARRLASRRLILCASPDYLARRGAPRDLSEVASHDGLIGSAEHWRFTEAGREVSLRPTGRWRCNSGAAVLDAVLQGLGLCQLPDFYVAEALASGALVSLLDDQRPPDEGVWAVHPHPRHVPPKVRAMIDWLHDRLSAPRSPA